jgi:hypothetical protein
MLVPLFEAARATEYARELKPVNGIPVDTHTTDPKAHSADPLRGLPSPVFAPSILSHFPSE